MIRVLLCRVIFVVTTTATTTSKVVVAYFPHYKGATEYKPQQLNVMMCTDISRTGARCLKVGGRGPVIEPIELKLVDCNL